MRDVLNNEGTEMRIRLKAMLMAVAASLFAPVASAEQITVTHWGVSFYGAPFAVALDKGWFKPLNIDGFITSSGGGTSVRNTLASPLPYGEVALPAAVEAIKSGQPLIIVNSGVGTVADILWVAKKGSPIKSIQDLAGKKVAYTRPKSVSNMLILMALRENKIDIAKVNLIAAGGPGANFTAVMQGAVDVGMTADPIWSIEKGKLQPVFWVKDVMSPKMTQTVGVTTTEFARKKPEVIRGIIEVRRKGVQFIRDNPDEAADIVARQYKISAAETRTIFRNFLGFDYWDEGAFDLKGMDSMLEGLRIVGELQGSIDWSKLIDQGYLPKDLQTPK